MKATGIVRRIEACVIIGQTAQNPHKHWGFPLVCPIEHKGVKIGFSAVFIHSKSEVNFTSLFIFCNALDFCRMSFYKPY